MMGENSLQSLGKRPPAQTCVANHTMSRSRFDMFFALNERPRRSPELEGREATG